MPVNEAIVGTSVRHPRTYAVGRAKISEFAAAVGANDRVHTEVEAARAAGYRDLVAPPTFAIVVGSEAAQAFYADPDNGIDFSRVVHGEQKFTHHRPMVAGDEITVTRHVDQVRSAGGHQMVTTRMELTDVDGEPVCTAVSTIVIRGEDRA